MSIPKRIVPLAAVAVVGLAVAWGSGLGNLETPLQGQGKEAPMFEVDPFWPRPLPNH